MSRIFLVGFMGAGKSSVGRALAGLLGYRFVDLDRGIEERLGCPIPEVFARRGEAEFRAAEHDELVRLAGADDVVVATGGGAFCNESNRDLIHRSGSISVYLELSWDELRARLARDHADRPMYADDEQARRLFEERRPLYRLATMSLEIDGAETAERVAGRVFEALRETSCAT